jgi:hypothetical protein
MSLGPVKYSNLELDLSLFERELLEYIIKKSCEENISVNKVIENILETYLKKHETSNI